ncbi:crotonase/enoyl-CoA hydratase family protein [Pseudonocardia ailaonensis]|uniref:Crotonase/enoyl-CoA hydratase family protein n=1 Tax=Pseudonocardia ailaonensis TaxID=367279 RepID=A0ABN2N4U7_9PSEU
MTVKDFVGYEVDDRIAVITFARPEKRNAMTFAMLDEYEERVRQAGRDPEVRAVVVFGSGGSFCAGIDLADLDGRTPEDRARDDRTPEGLAAWPLVACPKPTVAAVEGYAVGMGAEISSQADVRIAGAGAKFLWNFGQRGLVADTGAGTWLLPRLLGPTTALDLLYSGRMVDAAEAARLGYVSAVVPAEDLLAEAVATARRLAVSSPFANGRTKELLYRGLGRTVEDHMVAHRTTVVECLGSDDHREGVAAFLEKRPARF